MPSREAPTGDNAGRSAGESVSDTPGREAIACGDVRDATVSARLEEQLRRRGIALCADEFMQVVADALDDLPAFDWGSPASSRRCDDPVEEA